MRLRSSPPRFTLSGACHTLLILGGPGQTIAKRGGLWPEETLPDVRPRSPRRRARRRSRFPRCSLQPRSRSLGSERSPKRKSNEVPVGYALRLRPNHHHRRRQPVGPPKCNRPRFFPVASESLWGRHRGDKTSSPISPTGSYLYPRRSSVGCDPPTRL